MKTTELDLVTEADGSEEVIVNQGAGSAAETKRMPASMLAAAGTRPTPDELKAAVLAALIQGENITFVDNGDGTTGVKISDSPDLKGTPTADTAAPGTDTRQLATTAFVKAAADAIAAIANAKQGHLLEGVGVHIVDNLDGTFTISAPGGGGGGGLVDGNYGDVVVSGGGTVLTVVSATNAAITVPDEVYGPAWSGKMGPPTKNALFNKLEGLNASIAGRVAATAVGAANGVAALDAGGKVPAGQLPSYVDDVLEYSNATAFPAAGETGKIYVALDTNKQSRWSGTAYVELTASPGTTDNVPEGPTNKYYTDVRVRAAIMTGLVDVVGTPAGTDSLLTILGKFRKQVFGGGLMATSGGIFTGPVSYGNAVAMNLTDAGGSHPALVCQADNTIVFYATDAAGNQRAVWSVLARNSTAPLVLAVDLSCVNISGTGNAVMAGYGDFTSPGTGTSGGVRLRAPAGDGTAYIQITNHAASVEWGNFGFTNGACTWNGTFTAAGNITYSSDVRFKSNIRPFDDASAVLRLEPKRYVKDGREQVGFIAQDVEQAIPEAVLTADGEEGYKSLDLGPIVAALVAQVKALSAEVEALKAAA